MDRGSSGPPGSAVTSYIYDLNGGGPSQPPPPNAAVVANGGVPTATGVVGPSGVVPGSAVPGSSSVSAAANTANMIGNASAVPSSATAAAATHHLVNTAAVMAPDENYCLRWNDYEKKYAETFKVLRDDEHFTDVTLATEGHSVKAHRVILSACSNYFHAILKTMSPWQHPVLVLQDVKSADLTSLMDFIYFGQVSVTQDSLQSFLKVADKLKIKGLCDTLAPAPPPPIPPTVMSTQPTPVNRKDHIILNQSPVAVAGGVANVSSAVASTAATAAATINNFEGLLPRTPYIPEPSIVSLTTASTTQVIGGMVTSVAARPPPAAHQSPRQMVATRTRPSTGEIIHYASPPPPPPAKRAKFSSAGATTVAVATAGSASPQSILRNQLQFKESPGGVAGVDVEVKAEPMAILAASSAAVAAAAASSSAHEEVPSSGVNVTEYIVNHENDLTLPLGHGISPGGFMFSPDPASAAAASAAAAASDHHNSHMEDAKVVTVPSTSSVSSVGVPPLHTSTPISSSHHHISHHQQQQQLQHHHQHHQHQHQDEQPQDLTPTQVDTSSSQQHSTPEAATSSNPPSASATPNSFAGASPSGTPTPPSASASSSASAAAAAASAAASKKDRNTRKTCNYCHKDFHEMSLKRHIKDVHFRSQNTYVICPQCCKQVRYTRVT